MISKIGPGFVWVSTHSQVSVIPMCSHSMCILSRLLLLLSFPQWIHLQPELNAIIIEKMFQSKFLTADYEPKPSLEIVSCTQTTQRSRLQSIIMIINNTLSLNPSTAAVLSRLQREGMK